MLNYTDGVPFTRGWSAYFDHDTATREPTAKIFVRVQPDGLDSPILAQLDTGAPWTILDTEVAQEIGLLDGDGEPLTVSTRSGNISGRLEQTTITILAEEGESLSIMATVLVSRQWPGRTFLGYSGLLEKIRFGIDPQANRFYFGGYD